MAPMMDRTDRHFRFMMRAISLRTELWTEMIVAQAVVHGDRPKLLGYDAGDHPVVCQIGGDDPVLLAQAAKIVEDFGYDGINLNVGCPSPRVSSGNFGACLMKTPEVVAEVVAAMQAAVKIPVSVKHRIGVDDLDRYEDMVRFVEIVKATGVTRFSVHARKAWLNGLSPRENREIPPLQHHLVYDLKRAFPELRIELNGGITSWEAVDQALTEVDAVMIGRWAVDDPWAFAAVDRRYHGVDGPAADRDEVVVRCADYVDDLVKSGGRASWMTRHLLNLYAGMPGSRVFKRILTEGSSKPGADGALVRQALDAVLAQRQHHASQQHGDDGWTEVSGSA